MIVKDVVEFYNLILICGLRKEANSELTEIIECVGFYSGICGCNEEAKITKFNECNERYRNFLRNNLYSISDTLLNYEKNITFYFQNEFVTQIAR